MKIKLNPDEDLVLMIQEGLEKSGGYCPCRRERTEENKHNANIPMKIITERM